MILINIYKISVSVLVRRESKLKWIGSRGVGLQSEMGEGKRWG